MKSPFPGMDPYIEASDLWGDFHSHLIAEIKSTVALTAPDHYVIRTSVRGYIVLDQESKEGHRFQEKPTSEDGPVTLLAQVATEYRENFIEIYDLHPERRLITCLEVLSPSNKRRDTQGWEQYLRKRQGLMLGEANLVEIDLLRGGQRMPMIDPWPNSPYILLVCRRERAPYCRVWPAHFQRPLPTIPVPLSKPDPDVMLNLQSLVEAIYERSRYDSDIDYTKPLQPALKPEEAAWLEQQLRARQAPPAQG